MFISVVIINIYMHTQFILASSSKSRLKILKQAGINFIQQKPLCDEDKIKKNIFFDKKSPGNYAKRLSLEKAISISVLEKNKDKIVMGCDTIIVYKNKIIQKARNIKQAQHKIKMLSGNKHKIISAVTLCKNKKKIWQCQQTTNVQMRKLNQIEISNYLEKAGKKILDSVGCYQIESLGPTIIENINGDFFNVMGLPLFKILKYLFEQK